jgi:two-component system sensor histidine kinase AlgZ
MDKVKDQSQQFFLPDLCSTRAVLFLVLVAELLAIVIELASQGISEFRWHTFGLTSLFIQWVVLASAACLCAARSRLCQRSWSVAAGISYLIIIAVVILTSILAQLVLVGFNLNDWRINYEALVSNVLIAAVLGGIALRYFYLSQQLRLREQLALQSRIDALQARIRPHFLFNSMNTIASLIAIDPPAAETAVEDLCSLFRASLADSKTEVTLAEELEVCRCYARIEQARLGERLQLDWQLRDVPMDLAIPGLSLQPLLENAIYHGIQQLPEGGKVVIKGLYQPPLLSLTISNPVPATPAASSGTQIAQANIHHRLQSLYGEEAGLRIEQQAGLHTVIVQYPVPEPSRVEQ